MKKIKVDEDVCIGCGACMSIAPDVFEMNEEGLATVKKDKAILEEMEEEMQEDVLDALEGCPTGAIVKEELEQNDIEEKKVEKKDE